MPIRAQALTMHYFATDADGPKTGDVGNHALRIIEDGVIGSIAGSPAEVDATNAPGIYKVAITGAENTADVVTLCGKSSSSGVTISPSTWCNITNADADVAAILTDTGTTLDGKLNTIDGIVDAILVDTGTDGVVLANDAITAAKIADDAITADQLADNAITAGKIASNAITAGKIASNAITSGKLAADSVGASQLAADGVTEIATAIAAKALTAASAVPGSTPTVDQALMWLYQRFRYKVTQTSTQQKMHESDNSTVLGTSTISDDGTTVTQGGFS
jgi:hypothetical protein